MTPPTPSSLSTARPFSIADFEVLLAGFEDGFCLIGNVTCAEFKAMCARSRDTSRDSEMGSASVHAWAAGVVRVWREYWKPKTDHRYGRDFAAFVGERLLNDFQLDDIRALAATPQESTTND